MRKRGIGFATVTLAAGISSTGDPELDRRLPFDEPYRIPQSTASAIRRAQADGGRIVAIGTTVVRALEHAGGVNGVVSAGDGIADQRLGRTSRLRIVDAILSGTHEPDSSHYQLLRAFTDDETMAEASAALEAAGYQTHEFGDSVLIERQEDQSNVCTTINAELAEPAGCPERSTRSSLSSQRAGPTQAFFHTLRITTINAEFAEPAVLSREASHFTSLDG
jgi:S-adenosylmethionine:tRNA ribosyltransferase-isomerase